MSFLHPWMLGLLALGGLIWLLHVRQRIKTDVSSVMIWERVRQRRASRQLTFHRPRINLLMVLQLSILLAFALALAEPLVGANRQVGHWIYVVDNSASMQSGGQASPGNRAGTLLAERLREIDASARSSVIVAGSDAHAVFANQRAGAEGLDARLAEITPEDGAADWPGAARLVRALTQPDETTRVVVLSDGGMPDDFLASDDVEILTFEGETGNAGLSVELVADGDTGVMMAQGLVRFTGDLTRTVLTVTFHRDGDEPRELVRREIALEGADDGAVLFTLALEPPGDGVVTVGLAEDALDIDNRAHSRVRDPEPRIDVLYLGVADHPLVRALSAIRSVDLTVRSEVTADAGQYDLVVANGIAQSPLPAKNLVLVGAANGGEALPHSPIVPSGWAQGRPLTDAVAWPSLSVERAVALAPEADAEVLAGYGSNPLVDVSATDAGLLVRLAFDPAASNWPDRSDFVVFFDQLVRLAVPGVGQAIEPVCVVGALCTIGPAFADARLERIDQLDGTAKTVAASFVPTRAGLFELTRDGRSRLLAVHPPAVSDVGPQAAAAADTPHLPARPLPLWPWLLGLTAIVLVAEAVLANRRNRGMESRLGAHGLRIAAFGLAALAILDPRLPMLSTGQTVMVVVPADGASELQEGDRHVLAYRDVLDPPPAPGNDARSLVGDLADAVDLAHALLPQGEPGAVIAAGRVPLGEMRVQALAHDLARQGIAVDGLAALPPKSDVWAAALTVPDRAYPSDSFALQAIIGAAEPVEADVEITADGRTVHSERIALQAGENRVAVPVTVSEPGPVAYEVVVTADADPEPGDNVMGQVLDVGDPGRVAVLAGEATSGALFAKAMTGQGFEVDRLDPSEAPAAPGGWRDYDALALMNLPASSLRTDQQRAIKAAVREDGLGLLVLGGANSFGPGGYLETPLDQVSPVSSRVPRDKPGVALVFVLDRSSSMSQPVGAVTRLDIAKQATLAATRLLDEDSSIGVVTFDSSARLSLPLTSVSDMDFIERSIEQISLGGGTALQRGLSAGYAQIRDADASARHIIVMTDGMSQPSDYSTLMRSITRDDVSVSTVAIGEEAEPEILEWLASEGDGLFHATTDFEALPSILSQEAMRLSGDAFETVTARPKWIEERPDFLEGLPDPLPEIEGYVLASTKPDAHTLATVDDATGQPVPYLAYWQYGLGHVMALTTDAFGGWTADWQDAGEYPRLFSQTLRAFMSPTHDDAVRIETYQDASGLHLEMIGLHGQTLLVIAATDAADDRDALPVASTREGAFHALYQPETTGPAFFRAGLEGPTFGAYVNYPVHLNPSATMDGGALLAAMTGGRLLAPGEPHARSIGAHWTRWSIWPLLAGAALALFLLDLINRYSGLAMLARPAGQQSR